MKITSKKRPAIKLLFVLILFSSVLHGSPQLFNAEEWMQLKLNFYTFIALSIFILFTIIRIFEKTKFITLLFYGSLLIFIKTLFSAVMYHYTPKLKYHFQTPMPYENYEGNKMFPDSNQFNIIDIYIEKSSGSIFILDDNNNIYRTSYHYADISWTPPTFFYKIGHIDAPYDIKTFIFYDSNTIYVFDSKTIDLDSKAYVYNIYQDKTELRQIPQNISKRYENLEIKDKKYIDEIKKSYLRFSYNPFLFIDKEKKELQFCELLDVNSEKCYKPIPLKKIPKLAIYSARNDSIYVVYSEEKGIYKLHKKNADTYNAIQKKVRSFINDALNPYWHFHRIFKSDSFVRTDEAKKFRDIFIHDPKILHAYTFNYTIAALSSDKATVIVTTENRPGLKIKLFLEKNKEWNITKITNE